MTSGTENQIVSAIEIRARKCSRVRLEGTAMSAAEALKSARAAGIRLGVDGDALTLEASAAPPPAVLDLLSRHKANLVALRRPTNDGWLPHVDAAEWLNRNPVRSPPSRCLGCGDGEHAHDQLLPFGTEPAVRTLQ